MKPINRLTDTSFESDSRPESSEIIQEEIDTEEDKSTVTESVNGAAAAFAESAGMDAGNKSPQTVHVWRIVVVAAALMIVMGIGIFVVMRRREERDK